MQELRKLLWMIAAFLAAYLIPFSHPRVSAAILEAFHMLQDYAREHVLFCLVPAFFIAGAIGTFVAQASVIRYFSGQARQWVAYSVASVSGGILAVCSCTVLPLFAGIYRRGAGLGPAIAFLYSGPAINILAIVLTARILGWQLGLARAVGAILFAIIIGLIMAYLFRHEEQARTEAMAEQIASAAAVPERRSGLQTVLYFGAMAGILIFASWNGAFALKWYLTGGLLLALAYMLVRWFQPDERSEWLQATWEYTQQILPLLFVGVMVAGALMGRPGSEAGLIPVHWVEAAVGGNSLGANLLAAAAGALMYFATLTEVPILQGLMGAGMGKGPALALLLAGPTLSLPSILVIRSILGNRKTAVYVGLVVSMATVTGMVFGALVP